MYAAVAVLILLSLVGHGALWLGLNNRWHGLGLPRTIIKSGSLILHGLLVGLPLLLGAQLIAERQRMADSTLRTSPESSWAWTYISVCAVAGVIHIPIWGFRRWQQQQLPENVLALRDQIVDLCELLGTPPTTSPRTKFFCRLPYNHLWEIQVSEFEVVLANLPEQLEGLSICHISDLHFSHRIERPYYEQLVRLANATQADLVALTGDICDKSDRIPWIVPILSALTARVAKLSVLGNHDLRTRDVPAVRAALAEAGFRDLGGRVELIAGLPIVAAGNELPWFPDSQPHVQALPPAKFRLLLSHSPDQFRWAQRHQFDLMLAGHTHGGQIRLPLLGPIVCPSLYGTKYASGFFATTNTLLHVSRGSGSLFPYRLNCRPQVVKLVLRKRLMQT